MNKILEFLYNILLSILITLFSPILIWVFLIKFGKVVHLINYGRLGLFNEKVRVETSTQNVLWEGNQFDLPKTILSMNVYSYWVEDNTVVIKVYRNDKKIEKLNKELANKGEDDE